MKECLRNRGTGTGQQALPKKGRRDLILEECVLAFERYIPQEKCVWQESLLWYGTIQLKWRIAYLTVDWKTGEILQICHP